MTFVEMPMTAHPSLERYADGVRNMIQDGARDVRIPKLRSPMTTYSSEYDAPPLEAISTQATLLSITRAAGPAPFVGDPRLFDAYYLWYVAKDEAGPWIAADSELVWVHR